MRLTAQDAWSPPSGDAVVWQVPVWEGSTEPVSLSINQLNHASAARTAGPVWLAIQVRLPVPAPSASVAAAVETVLRRHDAMGRLDNAAGNEALVSAEPCGLLPYEGRALPDAAHLARTGCIPPVNPGLSGAPLLIAGPAEGGATIIAVQVGAGPSGEGGAMAAVFVRSEAFVATYLGLLAED